MGIYAVTGGTKGIGKETVGILKSWGHDVINIDIDAGDIVADLGTADGRALAISQVMKQCPDGLDGLVSNAGVGPIPIYKLSYILSVNYFGGVVLAEGLYAWLKKKRGNCVMTLTCSGYYSSRGMFSVDALLNNCGEEERIGRLVDTFDPEMAGNAIYSSSKVALARWVRRTSASWAANGVNVNAVAPGAVDTTIMQDFRKPEDGLYDMPMATLFRQNRAMPPVEIAQALAFLVSPAAKGISGSILSCDGGIAAVVDSERV